jgi:hypothetical protein
MNYQKLFALIIASASSLFVVGQEQLKHEKKVFVSPDNKTYINKDLPVYFRIATSADPNAESYKLQSESTAKYANPMYFDTEGLNTLRSPSAVDHESKKVVVPQQDIIFEIYADGIAPATKPRFKNGENLTVKGKTYYKKGAQLDFTSFDETSGTECTYISLNQAPYMAYDGKSLSFDEEKEYIIKYYSVDHVGNTESPKTIQFSTDFTAPVTTYNIIGDRKGKVLSSKASIKISATDTLSGVDKIYYSINDGKYQVYAAPVPVGVLNKDNSKITYFAVDKLGNKEEEKVISTFSGITSENPESSAFGYYIDKEPPVISMEIEGDKYQGKELYISGRSKIKINASDDKSGVEKVSYSIDNLTLKGVYADPFEVQKEGKHIIAYMASDYVGNAAFLKTQQIIVDATPPVSKLITSGAVFVNRDTTFVSSNTKFTILSADLISGISKINYSADGQQEDVYSGAFALQNDGFQIIKYQGFDRVNNEETYKEKAFYVDNTAPEIHYNFSVKAIGEKQVRDEKYTIYPSNVMLYVAATDNASGGEKIEYKINGKPLPMSAIPIKGLMPGNYVIEVTAWDVLKNITRENIKFAIEN